MQLQVVKCWHVERFFLYNRVNKSINASNQHFAVDMLLLKDEKVIESVQTS